jgi:hypothetical protein
MALRGKVQGIEATCWLWQFTNVENISYLLSLQAAAA